MINKMSIGIIMDLLVASGLFMGGAILTSFITDSLFSQAGVGFTLFWFYLEGNPFSNTGYMHKSYFYNLMTKPSVERKR